MADSVFFRSGHSLVLLDSVSARVMKHGRFWTQEDERHLSAYADFMPCNTYEISVGRNEIVEPLVDGRLLGQIGQDERVFVIKVLLQKLSELVREQNDSKEVCDVAFAERVWPIIPSWNEIANIHVLVSPTSQPTLIDFGNIGLRPAWVDAFQFARAAYNPWMQGAFDGEFDAICAASNQRPITSVTNWQQVIASGFFEFLGAGSQAQLRAGRFDPFGLGW